MARDSERLLKAVVSDFQQKQDKFYIPNNPDGSFAIPEGTAGNTFFTGWGNNRRVTFEFGTGSGVIATRQVVAVLRFKRDTSEATYGYVLDALEVPPQKELQAGRDFTPSPNLAVTALQAARQYYIHACTSGTGQKDTAMLAFNHALQNSLITGPQTPAPDAYSRGVRLRARYNQQASGPDRVARRKFEEDARRILRGGVPQRP